ncbi:MAG: LON peptidase substrate-binding domain-containing protein [Bauldia sp.]|nr:LON peptidase substrate-binding domain-containing protein [Bauldia sp.]
MRAGNVDYNRPRDLPPQIPVFPLAGALLLPRGQIPLNIFEPRYLAMVEDVLPGNRIIGMIQPERDEDADGRPLLRAVGCAGRLTGFAESGDGRLLITLTGIARFRVLEEVDMPTPYRVCRITTEPFLEDFVDRAGEDDVDRESLLDVVRAYLDAHNLQADWESIDSATTEALVNGIAMMSPYGPAEKQALLEAPNLKVRAETLVALTEVALAREAAPGRSLQ